MPCSVCSLEAYNLTKSSSSNLTANTTSNYYNFTMTIGQGEILPYADPGYFASDYTQISGTNYVVAADLFFSIVCVAFTVSGDARRGLTGPNWITVQGGTGTDPLSLPSLFSFVCSKPVV